MALPIRKEIDDLAQSAALEDLMDEAGHLRDRGFGDVVTYSRKVFFPLTHLCRDVCHYCTFATPPRKNEQAYMSREQVLEIARAGAKAGCKEALFTLGDKPELRYRVAKDALAEKGHDTTLAYLKEMAQMVMEETGLIPHLNPGLMTAEDLTELKSVSASMGIMLETVSDRLAEKGMPHYGSPDKLPAARLETLRLAGEAKVPFTSGLLIGIGETREERLDSLFALRHLHEQHGHIQEIIIQNFLPKPDTKMKDAPAAPLDEFLWTIAMTRIIFGPDMSVQAPPNLNSGRLNDIVRAGINDWGGVSPLTPDFVNPEAPWPHLNKLAEETETAGKVLAERLTVYPEYIRNQYEWMAPKVAKRILDLADGSGLARTDKWSAGIAIDELGDLHASTIPAPATLRHGAMRTLLDKAQAGGDLTQKDVTQLFEARGAAVDEVCKAANELRQEVCGDEVSYVVTRNINYTNVCTFKCQFCAFSKGKMSENLRGKPYVVDLEEVGRRVAEAWARGGTEVCMQGGIHPHYTGQTYIDLARAAKEAAPGIHVHAFSPLEVWQGAETLGVSLKEFLTRLKEAGLGTLPGTAAEVLDPEVRKHLCPDKVSDMQWLEVMETAHEVGFRTTSTIMFGHIDGPRNWARHLLAVRDLQKKTGGFTEMVPLPFVHMEAPIYLKGKARPGPTYREAILMHAVSRLALHPHITNIQASWVKLGAEGVKACLNSGVNDLGGTLMNESITRAAGSEFGQEMPPHAMEQMIHDMGRNPRQRNTTYGDSSEERRRTSYQAAPLEDPINRPAKEFERAIA
jgi:FO synthase